MDLPIMNNIVLTDNEYNSLVEFIYNVSGINLGDNKKELVKARLMKRIRHYNFGSFAEYYNYVIQDPSGKELEDLLNAISTNVTSFFREKQHFDYLTNVVFPEMFERKKIKGEQKIRIWSAAASSGEEIYTILMTLLEYMKNPAGWDIKILGTDISTKALAQAKEATYSLDRVRGIPPNYLSKYFDKVESRHEVNFSVKQSLKNMAFFARLNLMSDAFPFTGKFDFIFCRNVMIYFDKPTQNTLVNKLYNYLDDNGYLFIGHSESLVGMQTKFKTVAAAAFKKIPGQLAHSK